ncbi:unnamed protein product [Rangifer tarandus platyrhynchus]|uniref:Uncharacterized protein n=1 Tax=Rangifer tarandus platyrhynchus TaxID=3082113 RepID=A0ABN8ZSB5_RANTA|nr:unnamed protein product [Rangifer tarandus platyrhynchus]
MGGKEGPRSAVHIEGGPAASRAGGTCGHSAAGNGQLAGACSTLGREAPRLAGVLWAPGVGSGRAPAPVAGGAAPRDRLSSCVRPHPPWSGTCLAQQALRPGPGLSGPLCRVARSLWFVFPSHTPEPSVCWLGSQNWVCGVPPPLPEALEQE